MIRTDKGVVLQAVSKEGTPLQMHRSVDTNMDIQKFYRILRELERGNVVFRRNNGIYTIADTIEGEAYTEAFDINS